MNEASSSAADGEGPRVVVDASVADRDRRRRRAHRARFARPPAASSRTENRLLHGGHRFVHAAGDIIHDLFSALDLRGGATAVARAASSEMRCTLETIGRIRLFELSEPIADSTHRPRGNDHGSHLADGHREHRDGNDAEENVGHASGPTSRVAAWKLLACAIRRRSSATLDFD
jgi:hypothetical protein